MTTDELKELAEEFKTLCEQAVTCDECKGEGYVEVDEVDTACPKDCDEGEYVPEDKSELPEDDYARYEELLPLVGEVVNLQKPDADDAEEFVKIAERCMVFEDAAEFARDRTELLGISVDLDEWPMSCINWTEAGEALINNDYDIRRIEWNGDSFYLDDRG